MQLRLVLAAVALIAASSAASAQSVQTVVQFGNQVQPVTISQSSLINFAAVLQVDGSGTSSATVVQNGAANSVGILQFGTGSGASSAMIGQTGGANIADIGQVGNNLNTGSVIQFGNFNSSVVFQSGP